MSQASKTLGLLPGDEGPGLRQLAVLDCLRRTGPMTTTQLTDMMNKCVITNVRWACGRLLARGCVAVISEENAPKTFRDKMFAQRCKNGGGRPSTLYTITSAGLSTLRTLANAGGFAN